MIQKIICYLFGHKDLKIIEVDGENGLSIFIEFRCQRCGRLRLEQYDK